MKILWKLLVVVLMAGSAMGGYWIRDQLTAQQVNFKPLTLKAKKSRFVKSTVSIGTVKPKVGAEVKVGSQISGIVSELVVGIGEHVVKGDVLALLDRSEQLQRLSIQNEAKNIIEFELEFSKNQLQRLKGLTDVSKEAIREAEKTVNVNTSQLKQAIAQCEEAKIQLGYTTIQAPISGTIASISTYEGETVAASLAAPTFVNIIDLQRQEIQTYVDESDIGAIFVEQKVEFKLESYPQTQITGVVSAINPKPEIVNEVVNYVVIIDFAQPEGLTVRPEMTAQVNFILEERENSIILSNKSVLREQGKNYVIFKGKDGWEKRQVNVGLKGSGRIEIASGLSEGDIYLSDKKAWAKMNKGTSYD